MPTVSKKQERFMQAVAHNPKFAKKVGIKQSVGAEFTKADKGKSFKRGGDMAKANPFMEMIAKKKAMAGKPAKKMAHGGMTSMGAVKTAAPSRDGVASKGKTKGKMISMPGNTMTGKVSGRGR
tara:strand:- start:558 stop:926 length:369 start_codon:yes stop_codon:yes gene_type:complete